MAGKMASKKMVKEMGKAVAGQAVEHALGNDDDEETSFWG